MSAAQTFCLTRLNIPPSARSDRNGPVISFFPPSPFFLSPSSRKQQTNVDRRIGRSKETETETVDICQLITFITSIPPCTTTDHHTRSVHALIQISEQDLFSLADLAFCQTSASTQQQQKEDELRTSQTSYTLVTTTT